MAITGSWKAAQQYGAPFQSGSMKWGTGVNPVHSHNDAQGRNIAPGTIEGSIDASLIDSPPNYDFTDEYYEAISLWGYSDDSGASDRPVLGVATEDFRGDTTMLREADWPSWGEYPNGIPGGSNIRDHDHGSQVSKQSKEIPTETVSEGWLNKPEPSALLDSHTSDPSQYEMKTSMQQRDRTRAGSQSSGREDEHRTPIRSRIVGMRSKVFSGGERHYDMLPRRQDPIVRPWWGRTAGTGPEEWLAANEFVGVTPVVRNPPADPNQGQDVGIATDAIGSYGYQSEDMIPYA